MRFTKRVGLPAAAALLGALFVSAAPASADVIIYQFTNDYSTGNALGCTTSTPCGTLTVTDLAGGGVSVAINLSPGGFWSTGAMNNDQLYFNLTGSVGAFSNLPSGWTDATGVFNTNQVAGNYNYKLDCNLTCGSSHGVYTTPFTFDIAGITTASFIGGSLAGGGNSNNYFLADLSVPGATGAANTGVAGATLTSDVRQVPEPMTLLLFGSGIAGIGAMRRRKAKTA